MDVLKALKANESLKNGGINKISTADQVVSQEIFCIFLNRELFILPTGELEHLIEKDKDDRDWEMRWRQKLDTYEQEDVFETQEFSTLIQKIASLIEQKQI